MADYIVDRRDIDFVLFEQLKIQDKLLSLPQFKDFDNDDIKAILDVFQALAIDVLAPTSSVADRTGCQLTDGKVTVPDVFINAWQQFGAGGWAAANRDPDYGGMGLPTLVDLVISELTMGASMSFAFVPGLANAAGHLLEHCASHKQKQLLLPKIYNGEWTATMCLTEPQAGSAVGEISTSATPVEGDRYLLKGNKIFITFADHQLSSNIIHLVLARVAGDPKGNRGISLFAVPKYRIEGDSGDHLASDINDIAVTALEHKMGIHGSPTCSVSFGDHNRCEGFLIGERCHGLAYMFCMMNEARIFCGSQGVGAANAAYQLALRYAAERIQGAKVTDKSKAQTPVAIIEHPDVRRNLMLCKAQSEGIRVLLLKVGSYADLALHATDEEERTKNQALLDLMTPIAKAFATDVGFRVCDTAIQIHGGYGYVQEYGVEQLLRDTKIAAIYEGTNGIQALDLLGRKMRMNEGALFMTWLQEANTFIETHQTHPRMGELVTQVERAKNHLAATAMGFIEQGKADPELVLLSATPFLEMFGYVEVARLLLEQAIIADQILSDRFQEMSVKAQDETAWEQLLASHTDVKFYDGKRQGAQFYIHQILPHAVALAKSIKSGDRSALDVVW